MKIEFSAREKCFVAVLDTAIGRKAFPLNTTDIEVAKNVAAICKFDVMESQSSMVCGLSAEVAAFIATGKKHNLKEVFGLYEASVKNKLSPKTLLSYRECMSNFLDEYGKHSCDSVTSTACAKWMAGMVEAGAKKGTIVRFRVVANMVFEYAVKNGLSASNPFDSASVPLSSMSHRQKEVDTRMTLTDEQIDSTISAADERVAERFCVLAKSLARSTCARLGQRRSFYDQARYAATAIRLMRDTGMRHSDVYHLDVESIGPDGVTIWTRKNHKRVVAKCKPDTIEHIQSWVAGRTSGKVFDELHKHYEGRDPFTAEATVTRVLNNFIAKHVDGASTHCFRHTLALKLKNLGYDYADIAEAIGHHSADTTRNSYVFPHLLKAEPVQATA